MSFRLAASFAASAFLVSCSCAPSVPAQLPLDTTPEKISLHFGWPAGWDVPVEEVKERTMEAKGHRRTTTLKTRWRMTTETGDGGLVLRSHDAEVLNADEFDPQVLAIFQLSLAAAEETTALISSQGEFLLAGGLERLASLPDRWMERSQKELSPGVRAVLPSLFDPVTVAATVEDDWNHFIGAWMEPGTEIGDKHAYTVKGANLMTGEGVDLYFEWTVAGRTPCTAQQKVLRCVRIETVSRPDQEAVAQLVAKEFGKLQEGQGLDFSAGHYEVRAALVADPDGLIPYRYERQRVMVAQTSIEGEDVTFTRNEIMTRTYHHP